MPHVHQGDRRGDQPPGADQPARQPGVGRHRPHVDRQPRERDLERRAPRDPQRRVRDDRPADRPRLRRRQSRGKLELTMTEESGEEDRLIERLVDEAVKNVFDQHFKPKQFRAVVDYFETGNRLELVENASSADVLKQLDGHQGFPQGAGTCGRGTVAVRGTEGTRRRPAGVGRGTDSRRPLCPQPRQQEVPPRGTGLRRVTTAQKKTEEESSTEGHEGHEEGRCNLIHLG